MLYPLPLCRRDGEPRLDTAEFDHLAQTQRHAGKRADRFTNDFDYLFFFVKEKTYYFEKQFEEPRESPKATFEEYEEYKRLNRLVSADRQVTHVKRSQNGHGHFSHPLGRNMRTVWTIPTHSSCEPHYSTYPEALCETPICAGCPLYICKACHTPARREYDAEPQKPHPYHYESKYKEGMNAERLNAGRESTRPRSTTPRARRG